CFFLCLLIDTASNEIYTLSLHDALPIFDSIAVNPNNIRVYFNNGKEFGAHLYRLDPSKATIYFNEIGTDTLQIQYWHFPSYLTQDRKSTRLNSSHVKISYAVFCLKKKKK